MLGAGLNSKVSKAVSMKIAFPETRFIGLHFCRWSYGSIFIQIFAVGFKKCVSATECVSAVQDDPRSMILVPIGSAHLTSY